MIGIYKITNPENEIYIGQSRDIEKRLIQHKLYAKNKGLKNSIAIHGWDNHKVEILCECEASELNTKESEYVKVHYANSVLFNDPNRRPKQTIN